MPISKHETTYEKHYYKALAPDVLVVATIDKLYGDWSAYIKAVPGKCHDEEASIVAAFGTKLSYNIAKLLFPNLNKNYTWRD